MYSHGLKPRGNCAKIPSSQRTPRWDGTTGREGIAVHESTLAKRYALALADLAAEGGLLQDVGRDLSGFVETVRATPSLRQLMVSPTSTQKDQHAVLATWLQHAACVPVTANFLRLLVDKRRMSIVELIAAAYHRDVEARSGTLAVAVQTPGPMAESSRERLSAILSAVTRKEIKLETTEEPGLLGGMVVQMGSVMMDYSIRSRLNRLKAYMKA